MTKVEIDSGSGFCFGVVTAINKAEEALARDNTLYCLGDIVHNSDEVDRLCRKGLRTITHDELSSLSGVNVLLRAHGEPPSTYLTAARQGITLIDATCKVVLQLQKRIKTAYDEFGTSRQIVIYGKPGHAEVNGLVGQTDGTAIVVKDINDLDFLDFSRPIELYSQTTKSLEGFKAVIAEIERRIAPGVSFHYYDTICRQVANRVGMLRKFSADHDLVLFVSGQKSSNGRYLFEQCLGVNPATRFVSNLSEIRSEWLRGVDSIGICGATSTPRWLMENVKAAVEELIKKESGSTAIISDN